MGIEYEATLYSRLTPMYSKLPKRKPPKTGKFEVYKDKAGKYRFRLKASNGKIIAISEDYRAKKSCINGILSVKKNALKAKIVDL